VDDQHGAVERHTAAPRGAASPGPSAGTFGQYDAPAAPGGELAVPSFVKHPADAERAALVADSEINRAAAIVRVGGSRVGPRLLSFEGSRVAVDMEVDGTGRYIRMLGQLIPAGSARIEVRQEPGPERRIIDADRLGRFVVEDICAGPTSLTYHRAGERAVTTDWTSL
jgi:hypothetical protein